MTFPEGIGRPEYVSRHIHPRKFELAPTQTHTEMALDAHLDLIKTMMSNGKTYHEISNTLVSMGLEKGVSVPSIKKFCGRWNLKKNGLLSKSQLEGAVVDAIQEVR